MTAARRRAPSEPARAGPLALFRAAPLRRRAGLDGRARRAVRASRRRSRPARVRLELARGAAAATVLPVARGRPHRPLRPLCARGRCGCPSRSCSPTRATTRSTSSRSRWAAATSPAASRSRPRSATRSSSWARASTGEGDPLRKIHWRSWARRGKPVVKEYQEEYFSRIALVLDTFLPRRPAPARSASASRRRSRSSPRSPTTSAAARRSSTSWPPGPTSTR